MNSYDDMLTRCNKMSFLLGVATGGLSEVIRCDRRPMIEKQASIELLNQLLEGIEKLYYTECDHEWIAIPTELKAECSPINPFAPPTKIKCKKCGKDYQ